MQRVRLGCAARTCWCFDAYALLIQRVRISNLTRTRQLTNAYVLDYRRVRVDLLVRTQFVRTAYVLRGMAAGWSRGMCMFPMVQKPWVQTLAYTLCPHRRKEPQDHGPTKDDTRAMRRRAEKDLPHGAQPSHQALMAAHTFGKLRVAAATRTLPRCTTPNNAERNCTPNLSLDCHAPSNASNKKHM